MDKDTARRLLDLHPQVSPEVVRRAYHARLHEWHPDRFREFPELAPHAHQMTRLIIEAYARLNGEGDLNEVPSEEKTPSAAAESEVQPSYDFDGRDPFTDDSLCGKISGRRFTESLLSMILCPIELLFSAIGLLWGVLVAHRAIVALALVIWVTGPKPLYVAVRYLRAITESVTAGQAAVTTTKWQSIKVID